MDEKSIEIRDRQVAEIAEALGADKIRRVVRYRIPPAAAKEGGTGSE